VSESILEVQEISLGIQKGEKVYNAVDKVSFKIKVKYLE